MEKYLLRPCPFCGLEAELHEDYDTYQYQIGKSEADAFRAAKKREAIGDVAFTEYFTRDKYLGRGRREIRFGCLVGIKAYIPRCTCKKCIGHTTKRFKRASDAVNEWNGGKANERRNQE